MIDQAHLSAQTFGDPDLAREVLGLFVEQCSALRPLLGDPALGRDLRADYAHTLRGSAVGVGADAVARDCLALEACLRENRPDADALRGLAVSIDATVRAIAEWRT